MKHPGPVTEQSADGYAATFDTNVPGTMLSLKHELWMIVTQGGGSTINISSTYGHLAQEARLFEVAEWYPPARIAQAVAHVSQSGRTGVVLIGFSSDQKVAP